MTKSIGATIIATLIALAVVSRLKKFLENTMKFLLISYPIKLRVIGKLAKAVML